MPIHMPIHIHTHISINTFIAWQASFSAVFCKGHKLVSASQCCMSAHVQTHVPILNAYMHAYANVYTHAYRHTPLHLSIHMPRHAYAHVCTHILYIYRNMTIHVFVYMSIHMCVHMYRHMHVHIYMHMYMHMFILIPNTCPFVRMCGYVHVYGTCMQLVDRDPYCLATCLATHLQQICDDRAREPANDTRQRNVDDHPRLPRCHAD